MSMPTDSLPLHRVLGLSPDTVDYRQAWDLQQRLHADVVAERSPGAILFLEHTPVYTAGRRTRPEDLPDDGSDVVPVDRGGQLTWHGPGQLVCYPVVALAHPAEVKDYVWFLEEVIILSLADHGVQAVRVEGRSGVWLRADARRPQDEKIAAVGLRVTHGVTMHGFALNCSNSLEPYTHITACGIRDAGSTTLTREIGRTVTPADILPDVQRHFSALAPAYLAPVTQPLDEDSLALTPLLEGTAL